MARYFGIPIRNAIGIGLGSVASLGKGFSSGPTPTGYWITTLNSGSATIFNWNFSIAVDSSGNSYSVGSSNVTGSLIALALVSKYNVNGAIQWQYELPNVFFSKTAVDSIGNLYAVGTYDANTGALLVKYNSSGAIQWQKALTDNIYYQLGHGIAIDASNNIYITGSTYTPSSGFTSDIFVAKYNSSGVLQSQNSLYDATSSFYNDSYSICMGTSGNYFVTGYTDIPSAGFIDDALIAKYTGNVLQWQRYLSFGDYSYFNGSVADSSGNVYAAGEYTIDGGATYFGFIVKYDSTGAITWQKFLSAPNTGCGFKTISIDSSGNLYVTGAVDNGTDFDLLIVKYNSSGVIQWQRTLASTTGYNDNGYSITVDASGNIYVCGQNSNPLTNESNALTLKLPGDGSRTGTYGTWTYAASSFVGSDATGTPGNAGLTAGTLPLTSTDAGLTPSTPTFSTTVTIV